MNGSRSAQLEALLKRHKVTKWAFMTAWNPGSIELTRPENDARQTELLQLIESNEYRWLLGIGEATGWPPEESLLVLGISQGKAVALARRFGQLAVLIGRRGEPARLIPSAPY